MQEKKLKADSKKKICKRLRSLYTQNWFLDWGKKMRKKGFTLVEMLIVIFVISTGLILIIKGMSESHRYLSETAQRTVALNLAKEGIEAVYNLRNSNWRRWSDKKNECRIANLALDQNNEDCDKIDRLQSWSQYLVSENLTWLKLQGTDPLNSNDMYKVNITPTSLWSYYRAITIGSLQGKEDWELLKWCKNGGSTSLWGKKCGDSTPKELRFCSKVLYTHPYKGEVQVCSIMTNFEQ